MASSGRMSGNSVSSGNYYYIDWNVTSQSISGNYSKISWSAYWRFNTSDAQLDDGNAYLSGNRWDNGGRVYNYSGNISTRSLKLAGGSFTLGHNSDGTKSISVSGGVTQYYGERSSGSRSWSLPTIPRNAKITGGWSSMNDEQNPTLNFSNPAGTAIDTLQAAIYKTDGNTALIPYFNVSQTASSVTFNLTEAQRETLRDWMANTKTMTLRMYLRSVIGGQDSRPYRNLTVSIVNANPVFDDATPLAYEDTNAATVAVTGDNQKIVQNVSNLVATITAGATAKKSATISSYKVTIGTETQTVSTPSAVDFATVNLIENTPITVTATDSRGNTVSFSRTVTILPWQPPRAVISAARVNNFESDTTVKADVTIDPLDGMNNITVLKVRYKKPADTTWGEAPLTNNTESTIVIDNLSQWEVQFVVSDEFGTTTYTMTIAKGIPIMFIDNQQLNIGISKFPVAGRMLDVGGTIYANDEPVLTSTEVSTAAGRCVKYSDGTMICHSTKQSELTTNESQGSVYASPTQNYTFPVPFIEEPTVTLGVHWASGRPWPGLIENRTGETTGYRIMGHSNSTRGRAVVTAIGRWK